MKPKKTQLVSRFFFYLLLLSFPLSVSFSQSAFILSAFFFLVSLFGEPLQVWKRFFSGIFFLAFGIYLVIFFTTMIRQADQIFQIGFWKSLNSGEVSDFWMTLAIPLAIFHISQGNKFYKLALFVGLGWFLNLTAGIVSVFTPYRLARYIQLGFQYPEGERLQHFAGGIWDVGTYLPIGLMATHLTYGGLLGLLAPGVFLFLVWIWFKKHKSLVVGAWIVFALLVNLFLIFYNQSRSIWVGLLFFLVLLSFAKVLGEKKVKQTKKSYQWFNSSQSKWVLVWIIFILIAAFTFQKVYESNWLLRRAIQDIGAKQTTENQRYFILKNAFAILGDSPILGIGNNRFSREFEKWSHQEILTNEWLWYELSITPKGHAHHDFIHFWIVGGLGSAILFLFFWIQIIRQTLIYLREFFNERIHYGDTSKDSMTIPIFLLGLGSVVLFPAGFFQCYMLDDEVALPFYTLVGILFSGGNSSTNSRNPLVGDYGVLPLVIVPGLLALSVGYWKLRTLASPEEVHLKKVVWNHTEEYSMVHLDGCLTHNYGISFTPKEQAMGIHWEFSPSQNEQPQREIKLPDRIRIELRDRDSFDQDKLYRAHESSIIATKEKFPRIGNDSAFFPESKMDGISQDFPGEVRFRDFRLYFYPGEKAGRILPKVRLNRDCL